MGHQRQARKFAWPSGERDHFGLQKYPEAIQDGLRSLVSRTLRYLALYGANGEDEKAQKAMKEMLRGNPTLFVVWLRAHLPTLINWPPGMPQAVRKAGLPED
jgi:hypothetical protein